MMKITVQKMIWFLLSLVVVVLLVLGAIRFFEQTGLSNQRMETIKEYSVKYDQIPPLNEETAQKIKKANQDYKRTSMYLGLLLIAIAGTSLVFYKFSFKNKSEK